MMWFEVLLCKCKLYVQIIGFIFCVPQIIANMKNTKCGKTNRTSTCFDFCENCQLLFSNILANKFHRWQKICLNLVFLKLTKQSNLVAINVLIILQKYIYVWFISKVKKCWFFPKLLGTQYCIRQKTAGHPKC